MRSEERRQQRRQAAAGGAEIYVCDVEHEDQIARLREEIGRAHARGSTAWSTRSPSPTTRDGVKPFHETPKAAFLQAVDISCYLADRAVPMRCATCSTRTPRS